ncbi:sugar phosphate isomerase/epimerase family protein [Spirosoma sp.]|uniref:sugar phosphate isomerase/epimerase family protein n=1 Tax=Spirosoma sp. TaxID=1899569 RepID=UPI002608FA9E|nr:sugar phosphate isomerase/epimerase family protein [Spirosoma sp.]MCX6216690.1 sugar phosphate isomerase/epimerase [Spirosoma sp.]
MDTLYTRRRFVKQTALAASALPLVTASLPAQTEKADLPLPDVHIFSKHLQFLNYADMASAAAEMGFAGVDLTVRPDGHVRPERVDDDLPKAAEALKKAGLPPKLMTTAVGDATNAVDVRLLKTASKAGFKLYRMKWYQYGEQKSIPESIVGFQQQLRALGELNKSLNLIGCYQNHAGLLVGASVWEIWEMLKTAVPSYMGVQYDIRHATVEGGQSWPNGLRLLQPSIKSIAIKDFIWSTKSGVATVQDVPLGEGIVDFKRYFTLLKKYEIQMPVSLHIEYPVGGAEHGATRLTVPQKEVFNAMKRDLNRLHELWKSA